jgi:hypothetical protein
MCRGTVRCCGGACEALEGTSILGSQGGGGVAVKVGCFSGSPLFECPRLFPQLVSSLFPAIKLNDAPRRNTWKLERKHDLSGPAA